VDAGPDWIQSWWERTSRHTLLSFYDLGKRLKAIRDDTYKRAGRRYGVHGIETIEEYFGWDEGYIRRALSIADAFTEDEIKEYAGQHTADGEPVSVRHLLILSRVDDKALRRDLLARTVAEGWRSWELDEAVEKAVGGPSPPRVDGRGRPLAEPRNFDDVLRQQERAAKDFVNRAVNVWEKPGSSLESKAVELTTDEYTEERAAKLKAHAELLDRLAQEARERADEARQVYERFAEVLAVRQQAGSKDEAQEEEPLPPPLGPGLPVRRGKGKRGAK
jgi:hypothetical protein